MRMSKYEIRFVTLVDTPRNRVGQGNIPMIQGSLTHVDNPRRRVGRGKIPWYGF